MNSREFFFVVKQMRQAQKDYFSSRSQSDFKRARALENEVDREIRRVKEVLEAREGTA